MSTPLDELTFPVRCTYPDCNAGPFVTGDQVDEHITEEHLLEAVWNFADDFIKTDDNAREDSMGRNHIECSDVTNVQFNNLCKR